MNHRKVDHELQRSRILPYFHTKELGVISKENASLLYRSQRENWISSRSAGKIRKCWFYGGDLPIFLCFDSSLFGICLHL